MNSIYAYFNCKFLFPIYIYIYIYNINVLPPKLYLYKVIQMLLRHIKIFYSRRQNLEGHADY